MKIKSLLSLFLALAILGTRVGYALNIHYCKDKIAKISLAYSPSDCNMDSNFDPKDNLEYEFTKKSCCEDDIQLFQNHEPQKIDQENFLLCDFQIHSVCLKVSPIRPLQGMNTIEQHP